MTTSDDRRPAAEAGRADDDGLYLAAARAYRAAYPAAHPEDDLAGIASFHWMRIVVDAVRDAERAKPRVAHDGRAVYEAAARLTLAGLGENDPSDWRPRRGILMSVWSEAVTEAEQRGFRDPASNGRLWHVIKAASDESERVTRAPLLAQLAEVTRERDEARAKAVDGGEWRTEYRHRNAPGATPLGWSKSGPTSIRVSADCRDNGCEQRRVWYGPAEPVAFDGSGT